MRPPEPGLAAGTGAEFTLSRGGAFAAAVLLMMLSEQILVSSGALFVARVRGRRGRRVTSSTC